VKQKENNIIKTEMIMQQKSIYNETYKPLFINEMDEDKVKDFSKTLSQKLRHVKLAISKANLGQNKYANLNNDHANEGEGENNENQTIERKGTGHNQTLSPKKATSPKQKKSKGGKSKSRKKLKPVILKLIC
jgi:hypothetical protein